MKLNIRRMIKELESKEVEIDEQEEGVAGGGVSDGTSDSGGTGAKKWESGVSRGSGNPAGGITHWIDNYTLTRGKANPLN
tara:strand:- start:1324 stop:1563 length:240 start_codon:yes stop_codon:yes gene_type:complete